MRYKTLLFNSNKDISGINLLMSFWSQISSKRKLQVKLLLVLMLLSGISETISVGSIIPFLSVLTSNESLFENKIIWQISSFFGISNQEQLIIPATFIFISSVILAAIIKLLNIWTTGRLSAGIGSELSYSAFRRTLYQPYSVHLSRNSSDFVASISIHLKTTISVLQSILSMISSIIVMLCICSAG